MAGERVSFGFPPVVLSPSIFGAEQETVHGPLERFPNSPFGLCSSAPLRWDSRQSGTSRWVLGSPVNSPRGLWSYRLWGSDNSVVTRKPTAKDASRQAAYKRLRGENGVEMLEFALVIPIFVFVLYGLIAYGVALSAKQTITHSAAEGARAAVGAVPNPGETQDQADVRVARERVANDLKGSLSGND